MGLSNLKRTPFLVAIISVAFVGGLFTAAYAGPILPTITLAGNTHTTGDAVVDGTMTADNYFDNGNTQTGTDSSALGGIGNTASGIESTVGGGFSNTASGNQATVGGGRDNTASGESSTVGGGSFNTATVDLSTVGGGDSNTASGIFSTVGGGFLITASGLQSTVGGGILNNAIGESSTVGGGEENTASGKFSTVGGGLENTASGDFSFAAGRQAKATHVGSFVWADSTGVDFTSTAPDQFSIRAAGGIRMVGDLTIESEIFCTDCIDSTDILDGTIQGVDIALPLVLPGTSQFNTVEATIFRDLDDNFFFANPASTSVFKALNVDDVTVANDIICTDCIDSADIAADAVTSTKIATDAVRADEIQAGAVGSSEIADGTIQGVDIDSSTSITATDFQYSSTQTRVITVSAMDFVGNKDTILRTDGVGSSVAILAGSADFGRVFATVGNIPDGAIIKKFTCYVTDASGTFKGICEFTKQPAIFGAHTDLCVVESAGAIGTPQTLSCVSLNETVDNLNNRYHIMYKPNFPDCDLSCRLHSAQIEYTIQVAGQ